MNTFFEWNTIWSRILIVKNIQLKKTPSRIGFFGRVCKKKGSLSDDLINQLACVLSFFFFSYRAVNFFFLLISFSFTQGDTADTIARYARPKLMPFFVRGEPSQPRTTGRPVRKSPSLHGQKSTPTSKFLGTAEAYFVCHIGPNFQISFDLCLHWVSVVRG